MSLNNFKPELKHQPDSDAAYYPLTVFDSEQQHVHMAKGWIVEGAVDVEIIRAALDRVVEKWRMLAGRIKVAGRRRYFIRIPLGPLPASHESYTLTYQDSELPLSHYVPLPIPAFSEVPPTHLFLSEEVNKRGLTTLDTYASKNSPLVHWHITRFTQKGQEYSCIGMMYNHGLFDGLGSTLVVKALVAELAGKPWTVPQPGLPGPGVRENLLQTRLDKEEAIADAAAEKGVPTKTSDIYNAVSAGTLWRGLSGIIVMIVLSWIYGSGHYCIVLPYKVHTQLAEEIREEAKAAGLTDARPGTGDILFSWFAKVIYGDGTKPSKTIGMDNLANLRTEWDGELENYAHNSNISQSLPMFTAGEVVKQPLHQVAYKFARGRLSTSKVEDGVVFWKLLKTADSMKPYGVFLNQGLADDTLTISNVSMARVADVDWSPAGGKGVVMNYVFGVTSMGTPPGIKMMTINGRLGNGDLVINCWVLRPRGKLLEAEVKRLLDRYA